MCFSGKDLHLINSMIIISPCETQKIKNKKREGTHPKGID
jgi:hypothetical protein